MPEADVDEGCGQDACETGGLTRHDSRREKVTRDDDACRSNDPHDSDENEKNNCPHFEAAVLFGSEHGVPLSLAWDSPKSRTSKISSGDLQDGTSYELQPVRPYSPGAQLRR